LENTITTEKASGDCKEKDAKEASFSYFSCLLDGEIWFNRKEKRGKMPALPVAGFWFGRKRTAAGDYASIC